MPVSRRLAWVILLSTVLTSATLRHFNDRIPESDFLPWPVRSLLFFLLVLLFLVFLKGWGRRQEIPYAGASLGEVNLLAFVPLLIALVGEKWFAISFYAPLSHLAEHMGLDDPVLDALDEFVAGAGLILVSVALLPLFPRLRGLLKERLSARALAVALAGGVSVLALLYALLGAGLVLLGESNLFLLPRWFGSWAGIRFSGQALLAFGEEFYYRGILQTELIFLLPALGLRRPSQAVAGGVGLLSLQFAIEHVGGAGAESALPLFLYTLTVSLFLGVLLVVLRSLWLCAAAHFLLNLFVLRGGLQFTDATGQPVVEPQLYVSLFLILTSLLVYARFAPERRALAARHSAGDPG